jgi:hypothetical protein
VNKRHHKKKRQGRIGGHQSENLFNFMRRLTISRSAASASESAATRG